MALGMRTFTGSTPGSPQSWRTGGTQPISQFVAPLNEMGGRSDVTGTIARDLITGCIAMCSMRTLHIAQRLTFPRLVPILVTGARSVNTPPMHVISTKRLRDFWQRYPDAERPLGAWDAIVRQKRYSTPHEVRQDFRHADFLGDRRVVFNIGGNKYRLVVDIRYDLGRIYVRHVLTHEEYDRRTADGMF